MNYILDSQGEPSPCPDVIRWAKWWACHDRAECVGMTEIDNATVSTVFLKVDHSLTFCSGPELWETMVFGGKMDQECSRCGGSREQAEAMHLDMVAKVKAAAKGS